MPLFVGEFDQTIDAKHRMAISSALRDGADPDEDGESFFLVLGADGHLWLYPDRYYRRLVSKIKRSPVPAKQAKGISLMFAMARMVKPDKQGRVVLPDKSMQRARVEDKVTLVGNGDHIEIWPTDEWQAHAEQSLAGYGELLAQAADTLETDEA